MPLPLDISGIGGPVAVSAAFGGSAGALLAGAGAGVAGSGIEGLRADWSFVPMLACLRRAGASSAGGISIFSILAIAGADCTGVY